MIKLFAFDLDGTLLQENQKIDIETLAVLKGTNIKYIIATGRSYSLVEDILTEYDLDCDLILNNGHEFISKDKKTHLTYGFDDEKIMQICDILVRYDFHISLQSGNGNKYTFDELEDYYQKHLEMSAFVRKSNINELSDSPLFSRKAYLKNTEKLTSLEEVRGLNILKVDAKQLNKDKNEKAIAELNQISNISLSTSYEAYLEICDDATDKGKLLLETAKTYGISPDEIAVFGDSNNDIELIKCTKHSFAMGNGKNELKQYATYITDTNDSQGVLKGIRLILKEENNVTV